MQEISRRDRQTEKMWSKDGWIDKWQKDIRCREKEDIIENERHPYRRITLSLILGAEIIYSLISFFIWMKIQTYKFSA